MKFIILIILVLNTNIFASDSGEEILESLVRVEEIPAPVYSGETTGGDIVVVSGPVQVDEEPEKETEKESFAPAPESPATTAPAISSVELVEEIPAKMDLADIFHVLAYDGLQSILGHLSVHDIDSLSKVSRYFHAKTKHLFQGLKVLELREKNAAFVFPKFPPVLRGLVKLNLSFKKLGADGFTTLSEVLASMPGLKVLCLRGNCLGDEGAVAAFLPGLRELTKLKKLDLSCNSLTLDNILPLVPIFERLRVLHLAANNIGRPIISAFDPTIFCFPRLEELSLSGNEIGRNIEVLSLFLRSCTGLRKLTLAHNLLTEGHMRALRGDFGQLSQLKELNLSGNRLYLDGTEALAVCVGDFPKLEVLDLSNNNIGDHGLTFLVSSLMHLVGLKKLYLSSNSFFNSGIEALFPLIGETRLQVLDLRQNYLGPDVFEELGELLDTTILLHNQLL